MGVQCGKAAVTVGARAALLVCGVGIGLMAGAGPALAVCDPLAASDVTAVCSGVTVNQNGSNGYGTGAEDNVSLTVLSGASVTGTEDGISLNDNADIRNHGTIMGNGDEGVTANTIANLVNHGTITGSDDGVAAITITNLVNHGTITGSDSDGIAAITITNLVNHGTIMGNGDEGVTASTIANLVNHGTITGSDDGVSASTITSLVNHGTITGRDYGVVANTITSLANHGTITGNDYGVTASTITSLVNHGTITGNTDDGVDMVGFGTVINTHSGLIQGRDSAIVIGRSFAGNASITNAGTMRNTNGPAGNAIDYRGAGLDTLTVLGESNIEGVIRWDGTGDTLNFGPGRSSFLTITDRDSGAGTQPTVFAVNSGGLPFVVTTAAAGGVGTATTTVIVVDPSSFGLVDSTLAELTGGISGVLVNQSGAARATANGAAFASASGTSMTITPVADHGPVVRAWAEVFGGWRDRERDGNQLGSIHLFGGAVAGIETGTSMPGTRAGFFVGGSASDVDVHFNSQDTEIGTVFAGVYAAREAGELAIDAAITVGLADYDQRRHMNNNAVAGGVDTARGDFDGFFVSPEITVSTAVAMTDAVSVKPSLTLRYAGLFLDGYTEKGSAANMTVKGRDVHVLSARGQVAVPVHTGVDDFGGTFTSEVRVGVDGRATISDDKVRATTLGQNLSFTAGGDDEVLTGFAGAAFTYVFAGGSSFYGNLETGYGTDKATHVTGRAGVKMPF